MVVVVVVVRYPAAINSTVISSNQASVASNPLFVSKEIKSTATSVSGRSVST
jgi:hypothetical protein